MPDTRYPRAEWKPGIRAGYTLGVIDPMDTCKCHFTAGYDSDDLIRRNGLAQFLVTRDGRVIQYAEVNAQCIDSGEWNDDGPGVEVEAAPQYGQEIFTPEAEAALALLVDWLHTEWGIPLTYYDGPRIPENTYRGFISHRALIQSQPHSDYWPHLPTVAQSVPSLEDDLRLFRDSATLITYLATANTLIECPPDQVLDLVAAGVPRTDVPLRTLKWLELVLPASADGP